MHFAAHMHLLAGRITNVMSGSGYGLHLQSLYALYHYLLALALHYHDCCEWAAQHAAGCRRHHAAAHHQQHHR